MFILFSCDAFWCFLNYSLCFFNCWSQIIVDLMTHQWASHCNSKTFIWGTSCNVGISHQRSAVGRWLLLLPWDGSGSEGGPRTTPALPALLQLSPWASSRLLSQFQPLCDADRPKAPLSHPGCGEQLSLREPVVCISSQLCGCAAKSARMGVFTLQKLTNASDQGLFVCLCFGKLLRQQTSLEPSFPSVHHALSPP